MEETKKISRKELIGKSLAATDQAIEMIREADLVRRETDLELRDLNISTRQDFEQLRGLMSSMDEKIWSEGAGNTKWMDRQVAKAKATADQALASTLMIKDVQLLEKKTGILKESVIQVNKAYYDYEKDVDMNGLMNQVIEMVDRAEKMEEDVLNGLKTDEESIEKALRGAIEGLYGLQSSNPKVMEEARLLAADLRIYRDAAANKNFHEMIAKSEEERNTEYSSESSDASFVTLSSTDGKTDSAPTATTSSAVSTSSSSLLAQSK